MIIDSKSLINTDRTDPDYWLFREVLSSLTAEIIESGRTETGLSYDVKLQINGFTVEPRLLTQIFNETERFIDAEADRIAESKLSDALHQIEILNEIAREAEQKIRDQFGIQKTEEY